MNPVLSEKKFIGNGRSAKVFFSVSGEKKIATKTFTGESVSKFILFVLTGSANPYTWCEDAIKSAMHRRSILFQLCQYWFGNKVVLPHTYTYRWNAQEKAFEIDAEFISGSHAPLLNPLQDAPTNYMAALKKEVMKPLEEKLIESGFDGLVWQAGKGNPVGASNFMIRFNKDGSHQWIWIDLESGLPALFAMNPLSTLFYYLPKCVKHKDWLFDNVDTKKLKNYIKSNQEAIRDALGAEVLIQLFSDCEALTKSQKAWKGLSRHQRSLRYAYSQKKITPEQNAHYQNKPLRWFLKNLTMFLSAFASSLKNKVVKVLTNIFKFNYKKLARRFYLYFMDSHYRWGIMRWFLKKEIDKWYSRAFLSNKERNILRNELHKDDISAYLTDFSMHLGLKPFVKTFEFVIVPILVAANFFSIGTAALIILLTGPLVRTVYTLLRMANSLVKNRNHYPFVALVVGALPIVGNVAYPLELLYQSTAKRNLLGRYMTYSFSAKIGAKIPIWGGKDSEIEHFFNRMCHIFIGIPFSPKKIEVSEGDADYNAYDLQSIGKSSELSKGENGRMNGRKNINGRKK